MMMDRKHFLSAHDRIHREGMRIFYTKLLMALVPEVMLDMWFYEAVASRFDKNWKYPLSLGGRLAMLCHCSYINKKYDINNMSRRWMRHDARRRKRDAGGSY